MKSKIHLVLLILSLGTWSAQAQESKLNAGNTFTMRIAGIPLEDVQQVSGNYTISDKGLVQLPFLADQINAVGLTPSELQAKVAAAYQASQIYNHPTVTIATTGAGAGAIEFVVTVGGEVRQPSEVQIRPGMNLYSAITKCGGPTEFALMKRVKLIRDGVEKQYDMRKISKENNPEIKAGDQIVVPGS